MREEPASPDRLAARIAARQYGVISSCQLAELGIGKDGILRRLRAGRLHRLYRGVYAVGHVRLSQEGRWMAATIACEGAVLSHRSAAELWRLLPAAGGPVSVTLPGMGGRRKRQGIRIHRSRTLTTTMVTRRQNIPTTSPARTLSDLRRLVLAADLRRAIRQAEVLGLDVGRDLETDRTRSELEHRFLRLCRRQRLPIPEVNAEVGPFVVDFLWRDRALVVETDGYRYHRGREAFEDDRARDLQLRLRGYQVLRFSYVQVVEEPRGIVAALRPLLR